MPSLLRLKALNTQGNLPSMFRSALFLIVLIVSFSSLSHANIYNDRSQAYRSQFMERRTVNLRREDPRLKYFRSRKANSCLRAPSGICTVQEHESFVPSKYSNSIREKQLKRQGKIRPWL